MAIIKGNPAIAGASGTADSIVYKKYYDKTVMSKKPDMSNRVLSEKQIESNERMKLALTYAKMNYSTEESKIHARIRLKVPTHKSVFHALVKEHLDTNRQRPIDEVDRELNKML